MKYVIVLPDGAADEPLVELDGRTPLQAARTPHIDEVSRSGRTGLLVTVPPGFTPGSDVATLSVLGYDPGRTYTGRAPLEAAAQDLALDPDDVVYRCNLTTVRNERMEDFSAGHIEQDDAVSLIAALNDELADERLRFHPGVMYRHLLIVRGARGSQVTCSPPHDIPDQPVAPHLPRGPDAEAVRSLMARARAVLEEHPVNERRQQAGRRPANFAWLWGQGTQPQLQPFEQRHGVRGACITAVDLIRGIARLIGWPLLQVDGATGYLDTNYAGKGHKAVQALDEYDLVTVHVEAPDEAGHSGDAAGKIQAIEQIDEHVVGPLLERLLTEPAWRLLVVPDHPTPVARRIHTSDPPPFCLTGSDFERGCGQPFDEVHARESGVVLDPGHELMAKFLGDPANALDA